MDTVNFDFAPSSSLVIVALFLILLLGVLPQLLKGHRKQQEALKMQQVTDRARTLKVDVGSANPIRGRDAKSANRHPRLLTGEVLSTPLTVVKQEASKVHLTQVRSQGSRLAAAQTARARRTRLLALGALVLAMIVLIPLSVMHFTPWVAPLVPGACLVALIVALRKSEVNHRIRVRQALALQQLVYETSQRERARHENVTLGVVAPAQASKQLTAHVGAQTSHTGAAFSRQAVSTSAPTAALMPLNAEVVPEAPVVASAATESTSLEASAIDAGEAESGTALSGKSEAGMAAATLAGTTKPSTQPAKLWTPRPVPSSRFANPTGQRIGAKVLPASEAAARTVADAASAASQSVRPRGLGDQSAARPASAHRGAVHHVGQNPNRLPRPADLHSLLGFDEAHGVQPTEADSSSPARNSGTFNVTDVLARRRATA